VSALRDEIAAGASARDAAAAVAEAYGVPRRRTYDLAITVGKPPPP
jgi:16S rRNA (cytidine(1402)-2'-O)-methyltransferase RmsI-like protein